MPTSVKQIIHGALRKLGAVSAGIEPSAEEYEDGLTAFRMMLDGWSLEDLMIPYLPTEEFALDPAKAIYSIGEGGDWNTTRPEAVEIVRLLRADGTSCPVMQTTQFRQQWQPTVDRRDPDLYLTTKDALFHYVEFNAYPLSPRVLVTTRKPFNVAVLDNFDAAYDPGADPTPTPASGFTLTGIQSPISFPSGYEQCIIYNLAVHLSPEYPGLELPEVTVAMAATSKSNIKRRNLQQRQMVLERPFQGGRRPYNIMTGPA